MNPHDIEAAIRNLQQEKWTYAKREETRRELDSLLRMVENLQSTLQEIYSIVDHLRVRVQTLEESNGAL